MRTNSAETGPALKMEKVRKTYGEKTALEGLSLEVGRGEIFGLIGENGAGKTTAIECALGTRKADSGSSAILGMDPVSERKRVFQRVGVQFQETRFQDRITLREACETAAALYRHTRDWKPLVDGFGLAGKEKQTVGALSGGERQKLAVVLALIPDPELVFLDELTTGLDPASRRDVWEFLKDLRDRGTAIVLTSHFMDEVEYLCDRVAILKKGVVVREGRPSDLMQKEGPHIGSLEELFLACAVTGKGESA
ncbi:MAG: ABC transporter ATP-binding protein [Spirochaetales bacterium]|nr:ABC transporter ATP-binding protein [Spirochaetales bacterium]